MILVTGAGGKTGKALVKVLSKVENICAFVHHEEQVSVLKSLGAEKIFVGDMRDDSSIRSAIQGARAAYHVCPNMSPDEVVIGKLMLDEAKKADVEHFVYHSVLHSQTEKMKHHWQKMRVEDMLFESGLPFTILQPAAYMQNLLANLKSILEKGVLRVPYSIHAKFSFVDLKDVAEAAKVILTEPNYENAIYELAGTALMSHADVAEVFSQILKRDVRAVKEDGEDWKRHTKGMSDYAIENLIRMFKYYDQWGLTGNPNVLRWILKREPTSLETFIDGIMKEHDAKN